MRSPCAVLIICALSPVFSASQSTPGDANQTSVEPALPAAHFSTLEFSKPKYVMDLSAKSMIAGRFDCGEDGSVLTIMNLLRPGEETSHSDHLSMVAIHPDGKVVEFPWESVPGYVRISLPKAIFSDQNGYHLLVSAEKDTQEKARRTRIPLVVTFDFHGNLKTVLPLDPSLEPLNFGMYPSGDLLIVAEDRLNHRTALSVLNQTGKLMQEIRLGEDDYLASAGRRASAGGGSLVFQDSLALTMLKIYAYGENLLLVPYYDSGVPIVELSRYGEVHSAVPQLPAGTLIEAFVPSDDKIWNIRLGGLSGISEPQRDSEGRVLGFSTHPSTRIAQFNPADGTLLGEVEIGQPGVEPACKANGEYTFLTSNRALGQLQIVRASER